MLAVPPLELEDPFEDVPCAVGYHPRSAVLHDVGELAAGAGRAGAPADSGGPDRDRGMADQRAVGGLDGGRAGDRFAQQRRGDLGPGLEVFSRRADEQGARRESEVDQFWRLWLVQSYGYYIRKEESCPCRIPQCPPMS